MRLNPLILLPFIFLLLSCGGGGSNECSIKQQNRFVHEVMLDQYLWYQEVEPTLNYADFDSPRQTLDFLKFDPPDRFSYITSASAFDSLFNAGQFMGYGFSFITNSDGTVWIRFVYDDSPAGRKGLERGDKLLSINGQTVQEISNTNAWAGIFGPAEEGYPVDLIIQKPGISANSLSLKKTIVNINTVLHHSTLSNGTEQVGYLVFNSFLNTSNAELAQVFENFEADGISKLILDMRYNGGGSVSVARNLGSYMNSVHAEDDIFTKLNFNDKNQSSNQLYKFKSLLHALDLQQLVIIATGATCSASEMIINGLRPFMNVKVVGSSTCGKPVGMRGFEFCDNVLLPVSFASSNHNDEGDYFNGLPANCPAEDDVSFEFGDITGPMLVEALYVSANDSCKPGLKLHKKSIQPPAFPPGSLRAIIGAY